VKLVLAALLACCCFVIPASGAVIGYWRFEGEAADTAASGTNSILDSSGNALHGTPFNGPVYRTTVASDPLPRTGISNSRSLGFNETTTGRQGDLPRIRQITSRSFHMQITHPPHVQKLMHDED
jgi:hypothetical protein